jgi:CRISPR/Cas system CSM-associated protein Csm2 small subunit
MLNQHGKSNSYSSRVCLNAEKFKEICDKSPQIKELLNQYHFTDEQMNKIYSRIAPKCVCTTEKQLESAIF